MEVVHPESPDNKHYRQRKKQLYSDILIQMEFYLSDANLSKDRFLSQLISKDPYVDLETFLKFNKIRKLTTDIKDIQKALKGSNIIELSEDKTKICRKTPVAKKNNVDECTIYVERLPADAEHGFVQKLFSRFGPIDYISIPRYKHNKMIKGFAFIEFDKPETAQKAVEYCESIGCKLSSEMMPEELCSIKTFEHDESKVKQKMVEVKPEVKMETSGEAKEEEEEVKTGTKRKPSTDCENPDEEAKKLKTDAALPPETMMIKLVEEAVNEGADTIEADLPVESTNNIEEDEDEKLKKKRKRKKPSKQKQDIKEIGLQVLSKKEWKKMRNKYLDLQKSKMAKLKQHLNRVRFSQNIMSEVRTKIKKENNETEKNENVPKFQYKPDVIVQAKFAEPQEDAKKMKAKIKALSTDVQFIDVMPDKQNFFIRFSDGEHAKKFCKFDISAELAVVQGDEEQNYWKKINADFEKKQNKQNTKTKHRGRDKLLKKAEKQLGKHIRFDNDD